MRRKTELEYSDKDLMDVKEVVNPARLGKRQQHLIQFLPTAEVPSTTPCIGGADSIVNKGLIDTQVPFRNYQGIQQWPTQAF